MNNITKPGNIKMSTGIYKKKTGLNSREIETETVVMDKYSGEIHQLNPTASYIWDSLDGKTSITDIISNYARDFNIDEAQASQDVKELIASFTNLGLLTPEVV